MQDVQRLIRFAPAAAENRIILMPDNDGEADEGFRALMWELASHGVDVKLAWSSELKNGRFDGRQPEDITGKEWEDLRSRLTSCADIMAVAPNHVTYRGGYSRRETVTPVVSP